MRHQNKLYGFSEWKAKHLEKTEPAERVQQSVSASGVTLESKVSKVKEQEPTIHASQKSTPFSGGKSKGRGEGREVQGWEEKAKSLRD